MDEYDPVLARAIEGLSTQEAEDKIAANPDLHGFARMSIFNFDGKPETVAVLRKLMNRLGAVADCEIPTCRRAGSCTHPKVRCFWENFVTMQKLIFPLMRQYAATLPPEEDEAPLAPQKRSDKRGIAHVPVRTLSRDACASGDARSSRRVVSNASKSKT